MNRYAHRKDANHTEVKEALEAIGVGVFDLADFGMSIDFMCFYRGDIKLIEVKDGEKPPSRRKLTLGEIRLRDFARRHNVEIRLVETVDQALGIFGARCVA